MKTTSRDEIRFILNDQEIVLREVSPSLTLLDYLRLSQLKRGTKEGCAEGDCGACTILVGRLLDGELVYESVNACIRFVGSLDGCHIVTVEHLAGSHGALHPVQQAMVNEHGSQCGFCTPGIVMSLYGLWMRSPTPGIGAIEQALQGNLCRCTGYEPIIKAAQSISTYGSLSNDPLVKERAMMSKRLTQLNDGARVDITHKCERLIVPANVDDLAAILVEEPDATIVAGSTDVGLWVTKFMRSISPAVFVGNLQELQQIDARPDGVTFGAGVTYTQFEDVMRRLYPQMTEFWSRIGGEQVRNMGTIGGNIANGSPIGDTPPALIALGARITLRQGDFRRSLPIEDFFIDYGKQDRKIDEFVEAITIPALAPDDQFAVHKISKRRDEDISAVCAAFRIKIEGDAIKDAAIAFGGMAATPKRGKKCEAVLVGHPWNEATLVRAREALSQDFSPISDWRASADYRLLVAQNLLSRFFHETNGDVVRLTREEVA